MAKQVKVGEVTKPVAVIGATRVYALRDKTATKFVGSGVSYGPVSYGPGFVVANGSSTDEMYCDNPNIWRWFEALMRVGYHVLGDADIRAKLPPELLAYWDRYKVDVDAEVVGKAGEHIMHHLGASAPCTSASCRAYIVEQTPGVTEANADAVLATAIVSLRDADMIREYDGVSCAYEPTPVDARREPVEV